MADFIFNETNVEIAAQALYALDFEYSSLMGSAPKPTWNGADANTRELYKSVVRKNVKKATEGMSIKLFTDIDFEQHDTAPDFTEENTNVERIINPIEYAEELKGKAELTEDQKDVLTEVYSVGDKSLLSADLRNKYAEILSETNAKDPESLTGKECIEALKGL